MLDKAAMYNGLRRRGTAKPMMVMPPENSPAAPDPATALPTINVVEFLATAHTTDPTGKN